MKVWALYKKDEPPFRHDKLLEEYYSHSKALDDLNVLNKYCEGEYYLVRQEEKPYRMLENADCFCYGDTVD